MDFATSVEEAVKRFYATGSNDVHKWILQAQASPEAWAFVWQLMDPSKPPEVQFYAATTLYVKISKHWREVPENEYSLLQARILETMKMPHTSRMTAFKLCEALASFLANTTNETSETETFVSVGTKKGVIERAMEILPYNSPQTLELLLRVLSAIPVEIMKDGNQRIRFRENVTRYWEKTTWLLQQMFQSYNSANNDNVQESLHLQSLECALAWLKLGQMPLDVTAQIYPHFIIAAAKYAPVREDDEADGRLWEVTQECLKMSITNGELYKRPLLLWEWSKSLVSLARHHGGTAFYEVLTSLGEANSRILMLALTEDADETHRWTSETLIEILLESLELNGRYPVDETHSCIPFGFWYVLQDDLSMLDQPLASRTRNALKPIYARLAQALLRKSELPLSPDEAGNAEERELFRCYRQDVADTLGHCYSVLEKDLLILLGQRLSRLQTEPQKWPNVESTLHAFNAISLNVGNDVDEYIAALIDLIVSQVPYQHYPSEVFACSCSAIGAYAEWIGEHPDPWLERVLRLVTHGLSMNVITSTPASMALKDIARECGPHLAPLAPSILHTIDKTLRNLPPGSGVGSRLMYAAGKLVNSLTSVEQQINHLDSTLGFCVAKLRELLKIDSQNSNTINNEIALQMKMIVTFLSGLEGNIGKTVLDGMLPIFVTIVEHPKCSRDDDVLKITYDCIERLLDCLTNSENEARTLLNILTTSYKNHPHAGALGVLLPLIILFGRDTENTAASAFAEMSGHTLGGVAACRSVDGDLTDLGDILDGYLELLGHICRKQARLLLKVPDQIPEMLRCGMSCLVLTSTARRAGWFLSHAIDVISMLDQGSHKHFVEAIGQELVCLILQYAGFSYPSTDLEPQAGVLLTLRKVSLEWTRQWIRAALNDPNCPITSEPEKELFSKLIFKSRTNKSSLYAALKQFNVLCQRRE